MSKSYEEVFANFICDIAELSGQKDPVVKIALTPETCDHLVRSLWEKHLFRFRLSNIAGELNLLGVQVVARTRDNF